MLRQAAVKFMYAPFWSWKRRNAKPPNAMLNEDEMQKLANAGWQETERRECYRR